MQGDLFSEVTQTFSPWLKQSVRIYKGFPIVEFEFTVGPIPIKYVPLVFYLAQLSMIGSPDAHSSSHAEKQEGLKVYLVLYELT